MPTARHVYDPPVTAPVKVDVANDTCIVTGSGSLVTSGKTVTIHIIARF